MRDQKHQLNQRGIVAIVVTIILMLVITLIVLSFSKISRREQRNALDRQLSTQAFYAAESGVNDARKVIDGWLSAGSSSLNDDYTSNCTAFATAGSITLPGVLSGSGAASYTCIFVDPSPPEIVYTNSDTQHVLPIKDKSGAAINTIEIYWDSAKASGNFVGCPPIVPSNTSNPATWPPGCDAPLLRVELVAAPFTTSKSFFIYPSAGSGGTINFGSTTGTKAQGNCTVVPANPNRCKIEIIGLGGTEYYLRVKPIYSSAALTIKATKVIGGAAELVGAQALIDVTGRATDVVRRIQVRVKANNLVGSVPLYGLEGTDKICKKFSINGTTATDEGSCWAVSTTPD